MHVARYFGVVDFYIIGLNNTAARPAHLASRNSRHNDYFKFLVMFSTIFLASENNIMVLSR